MVQVLHWGSMLGIRDNVPYLFQYQTGALIRQDPNLWKMEIFFGVAGEAEDGTLKVAMAAYASGSDM